MEFINREEELKLIKSNLGEGGLIIVYGRRRIGKTELLKQIKSSNIYYLVKEQSLGKTLDELNNKFIKKFNDLSLLDNPLDDFRKIFKYLADKRVVLILDEFPLLLKYEGVLGHLQEFLDAKPKTAVILCGSYISAMEKIKDYSSPIYGRRMFSLKLQAIKFRHLKEFFPKLKKEELVKIYGALGGVPEYLLKYSRDFDEFIKENFFKKDTYLYEDAELLLRYELRDLSVYNSILKSIASGATTLNEIAQKSFVEKNIIVQYLDTLIGLDIIKKELPYLAGKSDRLKERGALYFIRDNYFNFYYNFVYPYKEDINLGYADRVFKYFKRDFSSYMGFIFEEEAREFLADKFKMNFGRQWGKYKVNEDGKIVNKAYEIDLLSYDEDKKEIIAFEVKWNDNIDYKKGERILRELDGKLKYLPLYSGSCKIKIGLVARNITDKNKFKKDGFFVFDLRDM